MNNNEVDDVLYASMVIDDVQGQGQFNVDANRVYATGFSNGAHMAHRLGCQLSSRIAAIAPASGGMMSEPLICASDTGDNFTDCKPVRRVPVIHFNGATDEAGRYSGGPNENGNPTACIYTDEGGCHAGLDSTIDSWLAKNDLTGIAPTNSYSFGIETRKTWAVNADEVTLCKADPAAPNSVNGDLYDGGGHAWLGGVRWSGNADLPTNDLNASSHLWTFFAAHPMTGAGAQVASSDDFESGDLSAEGWAPSGAPIVSMDAQDKNSTGVHGVRHNGKSSITKTVSTRGKSALKLSYDRRTNGLVSFEKLYVECSLDGTTWVRIEEIRTQSSFASKSLNLPLARAARRLQGTSLHSCFACGRMPTGLRNTPTSIMSC